MRSFLVRLLSRCMFCDKFMLLAHCVLKLQTAEGTFSRPCCYKCFADYLRIKEETEATAAEGGPDEPL